MISEIIEKVGNKLGVFELESVGEISLQEVADEIYDGDLRDAEAVLASK